MTDETTTTRTTPEGAAATGAVARPSTHRGVVVSHTHWDRAWYLPFETFRVRLVRLMDRLLDLLERDERYHSFLLDGQTAPVTDYLAVRPQNRDRVERLVRTGRLFVGPWFVLPDLLLVSPEAVVRNLQRGHREARALGRVMSEGWVPDPFGHPAQMPQVLGQFGIDTYLFMRGLSADVEREHGAVFQWEAPDGSRALAVNLAATYVNAVALGHPHVSQGGNLVGRTEGREADPALAAERLAEARDRLVPMQEERTLLFLNGSDHMPEQPELPELLAATEVEGVRLEHGSLPLFLNAFQSEGARHGTVTGDLLGNAREFILSSVWSTRLYLKQANHAAQSLLERVAEPLAAWHAAERRGPDARPFLDYAWRELLLNHPHDDICGCSVDAVHLDDEGRFRHATEVGEAVVREGLEALVQDGVAPLAGVPGGSDVLVFNPHPWAQAHDVEADVFFPNAVGEPSGPARALRAWGPDGDPLAVAVVETEADAIRLGFLESTWSRRYRVRFRVEAPPTGYALVRVAETDGPADAAPPAGREGGGLALEDDRYRLDVTDNGLALIDKATGTRLADAIAFAYDADAGDTYSFSPVPSVPTRWAEFVGAERDPARPDALVVRHRLAVPERLDRGGTAGEAHVDVETTVTLSPHRALALHVRYENTARDGRLRLVVPTATATRTAWADGHFRLAERAKPDVETPETAPERYGRFPGELDYGTYPQIDFSFVEENEGDDALRTWVAVRGLPEAELLLPEGDGEARTRVAVTLHRAVGRLSKRGGRIRPSPAGPNPPTPGAQCLGPVEATVALGVGRLSREAVARAGRAFAHPAFVCELPALPYVGGVGPHARRRSLVAVDNAAVELSALRPSDADVGDGTLTLRVWNRTGEPQTARVALGLPARRWCPTPLDEQWDERAARAVEGGVLALDLGPHQIQTVLLR